MIRSKSGEEIYHFGIIDYLQEWDFNKKSEQKLKKIFMRKNSNQLSAVEPVFYCKRFAEFVQDKVLYVDMGVVETQNISEWSDFSVTVKPRFADGGSINL